jgi:branched-chain amino acid transport system permease protein
MGKLFAAAGFAVLAAAPAAVSDYGVSFLINALSYAILATAWAMFSGATRYVSLATVAFFGAGVYLVAMFGEAVPMPLLIIGAAAAGGVLALVVGLSTLRLSGIHFVIFTFGLSELIRQLTIWWEINHTGTLGRYVFVDFPQQVLYWHLLGLLALVFGVGWAIRRSRLGFALRVIGEDELVARHVGIDTTRAKLAMFAVSAMFMSATGAVMAPRWTYIDPNVAFNPLVSFQVLIMALLGGVGRLHGPVLGVVPMVVLFEVLSASFPHHFSIILGVVFLVIVHFLPDGVAGWAERTLAGRRRTRTPQTVVEEAAP